MEMEQELLTPPEHLSSPTVFIVVREHTTWSLVLCVYFVDRCLSCFPVFLFLLETDCVVCPASIWYLLKEQRWDRLRINIDRINVCRERINFENHQLLDWKSPVTWRFIGWIHPYVELDYVTYLKKKKKRAQIINPTELAFVMINLGLTSSVNRDIADIYTSTKVKAIWFISYISFFENCRF